jgi:type I restriction enzyme, S subunit
MSIPKGWEMARLEQVAKIQTGLAKGKKGLKNVVSLPYLRVANVQDGYLDLSEIKEIEVDSDQIDRYLLRNEDLLLTEGGDFDKLGRGSLWYDQIKPCLHQNHVFVVRVDKNKLIPYFFSQQVGSSYGKAYFLSCAKQTTNLASINSTQLKEFPVILPPLREQCRIAEILGVWDGAIDLLEKLITAKRKLKQGLMQQLLTGRKRFKEFGAPIISEGCIPDKWKKITLKETAAKEKYSFTGGPFGSNLKAEHYVDNGVRIIQLQNIGDGHFNNKYKIFTTEEKANELISCNIYPGDIILSKMGDPVARGCFIPNSASRFLMASDGIRLKVNNLKFDSSFLLQQINAPIFRKIAISHSTGSTRQRIGLDILRDLPILMPPLQEQEKIAAVLSAADAEISTLEKQLAAYKEQKRGLMQQLLTGRTRILGLEDGQDKEQE